ncbi:MAG: hypothetical protein IPO16_07345 [Saprospiraceae bacterium]|nr:hypothetical protein [Saprospiraceae bacterium]
MKLYQAYKKVVEELMPIEVAWFTTFNLNVELFEKFLLGQLGGKEATELKTAEDFEALNEEVKDIDIKVFYDYQMLDLQKPKKTTADFIAINPSKIYKEPSEAIFHPKVIFLKSKDNAYIITGSANLSFAAWSINEEAIIVRKISKYRNAREILDFFDAIGADTKSLNSWINTLPKQTSDWKFVHSFNKKKDIIEEFLPAEELTVWSPYFTEKTSTLINVIHNKGINKLYLVPDFTESGKVRITADELKIINKSDYCELKRMPKGTIENYRLVHAKVWLTKDKIGVGSWNFSFGATGLNTPQNRRNIEAGIVSSINDKDSQKLLNNLKPLINSEELASTEEELENEKEFLNKFSYSCNICANWQTFQYEFNEEEIDQNYKVRLPHNNKILYPLDAINYLSFFESYVKLLSNKTFSIYDKNDNEIFQGFLLEKEKTKRPVYTYSSLKDLFEALIDYNSSSSEKKNIAYSINGDSDDAKGEVTPIIKFSKSESYYLMFVSFQILHERIVTAELSELDKIGYRHPQSLTNISKLVSESTNNAVKELEQDSLLFHWFLINELNRCINRFNERSDTPLKVVLNSELSNAINFSDLDKIFIKRLKDDFKYEFI